MRTTPASRACAAFLLAAVVLSGCGGGGAAGTYSKEEEGGKMTLQLKGDKKAVMTILVAGQPLPSVEGTYTVAGDKVTVILAGDTDVWTLKNGTLTSDEKDMTGETMVLKKE